MIKVLFTDTNEVREIEAVAPPEDSYWAAMRIKEVPAPTVGYDYYIDGNGDWIAQPVKA